MDTVPPIPRQTRQHSRRKETHGPPALPPIVPRGASDRSGLASSHGNLIPPASPEVISSLITSLSVLSSPSASSSHDFDTALLGTTTSSSSPPPPAPGSPTGGSFGVDYGAFSSLNLADTRDDQVPLDELAASPPVIRTAKPPSGFSPLTAPKSPAREAGAGLKSILGGGGGGRGSASRPSSKGSLASRDADTHSIGNLSIERGPVSPVPELKKKPSVESWGKKTGRTNKGLMYMSSKERLREREAERKRASIGAVGGGRLSTDRGSESTKHDPFLAETPISEEPPHSSDSPPPGGGGSKRDHRQSSLDNGAPSPRPIPARDSSLRKTGPNAKRSSRRSSKRNSESNDVIHEATEERSANSSIRNGQPQHQHQHQHQREAPGRRHPHTGTHEAGGGGAGGEVIDDGSSKMGAEMLLDRVKAPRHQLWGEPKSAHTSHPNTDVEDMEDGAPFPAVAQGRRRDHSRDGGRRRSGIHTPDLLDGVKLNRSGSKIKRLSGPLSPRLDDKMNSSAPGGLGSRRTSSDSQTTRAHVGYERPQSADSIDDAVESYLCSPRLSQKIRHPQTGRVISFSEVGDSEGSAVFCCVGMGLTRYITAFYDELALTLKLRLITPDRPGVGDSEPYTDGTATPLSWPDDVYAICQALKITKFSILAHSAGAIYALATALRMPQHIRGRIHLLAPWIPPSQMSVFGASAQTPLPPTNAIPTSQRILRALPTPILKAANSSFMTATSSSITSSLPKTPKRKRKSNANLARERDKDAGKNQQPPPPLPTDPHNKENNHHLLSSSSKLDHSPSRPGGLQPPTKENTATEEMDRIRPLGTSPTSAAPITAAMEAGSGISGMGGVGGVGAATGTTPPSHHKKSSSTASAAHAAREAAVLAAAANALADRERQATYDTRLTHAIWELATTGANPAVDLLVCLERRHTIGFRYVDITRPVVIHHGSRDTRVPVDNVRWLGKTMRRCEVRVLEGEGHGLMASAGVMGGVLMEISKEWEDWGRLTGVAGRRGGDRGDVSERGMGRDERGRRGTIGQAR